MTLRCTCGGCTAGAPTRAAICNVSDERWRDVAWLMRWRWRCEDKRVRSWVGETTDLLARRSRDIRAEHAEVMQHLRERFAVLPRPVVEMARIAAPVDADGRPCEEGDSWA